MEHGWDVKRLLTQLVTSRAYRQVSSVTPELQELDPDNRLLARGPRFLPPERRTAPRPGLAAGGILSAKMGGPGAADGTEPRTLHRLRTQQRLDRERGRGPSPPAGVYTEVRRNGPYASFATFDAPNREVCTIRRAGRTQPLQAFVTMNDPVFVEAAQAFARRLAAEVNRLIPRRRCDRPIVSPFPREADESEVANPDKAPR